MSRAIVTPSLVMVGAPHALSSTTLRPLGPSVTRTVSATALTPRSSERRAASSNSRILGICSPSWLLDTNTRVRASANRRGPGRCGGAYFSTTASTSRADRMRYSSPWYLISVPPYFE